MDKNKHTESKVPGVLHVNGAKQQLADDRSRQMIQGATLPGGDPESTSLPEPVYNL